MDGSGSDKPDYRRIARSADQWAIDAERSAADADQGAADAERSAADADQGAADADQTASNADQIAAKRDEADALSDQRAADRDQARADQQRPADADRAALAAFEASRFARLRSTISRLATHVARARTGRARVNTAIGRDADAAARDETARRRDVSAQEFDRSIAGSDAPLAERLGQFRARATAARARGASVRDKAAQDRADAADERSRLKVELDSAHLDDLTGAYRREMGKLALTHEIDRARRGDGRLVVAFVDVDGLKRVNDRDGHAAGDHVLQTLVRTMRSNLRSYDPVVRYGGDEFVCGLGGVDLDEVERRFDMIDRLVQNDVGVGVSVGLAALAAGETLDQLMARADDALLDVKRRRGE